MVSQLSAADPSTIDYVTFNLSKNVQEGAHHQREKTEVLNQTKQAQVTIFTDMNVDNHEFDIIQRRKAQRAISAMQRSQSALRKNSLHALSALSVAQKPSLKQLASQRPVSGLPPTLSAKTLPQPADQIKSQKSLKNSAPEPPSRRPFSANPNRLEVERPAVSGGASPCEDEDDDADLRMAELAAQRESEAFSRRLMSSRPTTAYKKERKLDRLPFPELFDRSERTLAATFAKFGDLTYYTPVQRIGAYMDFSARLKRRHLSELIAYLKTSKKPLKPADEELNEPEQASKDFWESCLFIGVMPEEVNPRAVKNTLENFEKMDEVREA